MKIYLINQEVSTTTNLIITQFELTAIISLLYLSILDIFLIVLVSLVSIEAYSLIFHKGRLLNQTRHLKVSEFTHLNISIMLAKVYLYQNKFEKARLKFEKIINKYQSKVNKDLKSQIYNGLGICYFHLNDLELSISYYFKSIEINNNCTVTLNNLARAYEKKKLFCEAKNTYLRVLAINPKNYTAQRNLIKLNSRDSRI